MRSGSGASWGSIPACAGEPALVYERGNKKVVYPRVCGGTEVRATVRFDCEGLSPRVRGDPAVISWRAQSLGSIPACAGEPSKTSDVSRALRVYPRVCGGTANSNESTQETSGLSPRVRGNRLMYCFIPNLLRSIPACAGEPPPRHWMR